MPDFVHNYKPVEDADDEQQLLLPFHCFDDIVANGAAYENLFQLKFHSLKVFESPMPFVND